ncbi:MAG: BON domain-containing protein [Pirellulales bacterium]|nr:BON domain-containing protein [Pirellulales bacterium]
MKRTYSSAVLVVFILAAAEENRAAAQMFGQRSIGTSRASSRTATDMSKVGTVQGNERFIRGNRQKTDFVGSSARDSFVGAEQGTGDGRVRSAVSNLRIERAPNANQTVPLAGRHGEMYEPRLAVGFRFAPTSPERINSALEHRLTTSESIRWTGPVEVSVEGPTATLRGEVVSEHDRRLAELLVLFEPGISQVRNELRVKPSSPAPQTARAPLQAATNP